MDELIVLERRIGRRRLVYTLYSTGDEYLIRVRERGGRLPYSVTACGFAEDAAEAEALLLRFYASVVTPHALVGIVRDMGWRSI